MSVRRTRSAARNTDDDLKQLVLKLQALIPESSSRCTRKVSAESASKVLKETCYYIQKLNREVDDMSNKLSRLMDSMDGHDSTDVEILKSLLQR